MMKKTLLIGKMECAACSARIERVLGKTEGIRSAAVNLATEKATVEFDEKVISLDDIFANIENAGFTAADAEKH